MNTLSIGQYLRRPEMGAVLSLVAVIAFFVIFGGVNLGIFSARRAGSTSRQTSGSSRSRWGC